MKTGKIPNHNLTGSVLVKLKKVNKESVLPKVGMDFSHKEDIIFSDGTGNNPSTAWVKAMNNLAVSGAEIMGARVLLLLSTKDKDAKLKMYMEEFANLSDRDGIEILGGHTETLEGLSKSTFSVTMVGKGAKLLQDRKNVEAGYDVLMCGYAGMLGTNILIDEFKERLADRFSENFIRGAQYKTESLMISEIVEHALSLGTPVGYIHDISNGGVYKALYEMGEFLGKGLQIENRLIPVRQETIEITEHLDINPYMIDGTGAVLMAVKRGRDFVELFKRAGYEAAVIGKVSDRKEKIVALNSDESRVLEGDAMDEIYRLRGE